MLTKTDLEILWKEEGFRPRKRSGQNFLIDNNVKDRILRHVDIKKEDTIIEIGPGFGELTSGLAKRAGKVIAVEKDARVADLLKRRVGLPENVSLLNEDFLDIDIAKIAGAGRIVVYGSLPYYITSPIIEKLFDSICHIKEIYIVVQREVAARISAKPGSKAIGRLSLYVQYYTEARYLFKIGRRSFYPVPMVDSALIRLKVLSGQERATCGRGADVSNEDLFFEIIKKAYGQRRKIILNSLAKVVSDKESLTRILSMADIDPNARAENITLQEFARITNLVDNLADKR
ncbi:MAG: 16S rRNA (adenine(1518)-N(6)/adenine(1519)-N(6))-dimethyltransferase RsmA [Candidatus Omnitrophota bacterium]